MDLSHTKKSSINHLSDDSPTWCNHEVSKIINSNALMIDELGKTTLYSVSGKTKLFFTPINICMFTIPASNSYRFTEDDFTGKKSRTVLAKIAKD